MTQVSITIPAFNEGRRLPPFLEALVDEALARQDLRARVELVVVDDGSRPEDRTQEAAAVEAAQARLGRARSDHRVRFVCAERNDGKGSAIRLGWRAAAPEAAWLGFLDADGAVSAQETFRLVEKVAADPPFDLVAASRIRLAGHHIERGFYRHLQGRVFATLVEWSFGLGFYDTQCGMKLVRASLLRPRLDVLQERGWMLDVELLALMQLQGARMVEEPIDWADTGESRVRFGVDAVKMAVALRRIRRRQGAVQ